MSNNTVSVIMACYNCEKTVRKSIDSIVKQTYKDWVMICCDDGSNDSTLSILYEYKNKYPDKFIIIQNDRNRKLPYSLNHCLQYVETEMVARMDADDWSLPERFEVQVRFLREHPEYDLVGTGITVFDGEKQVASITKKYSEPTKETMLKENAFSHATIMTYKRVFDLLKGYSLEPYVERVEDVDLWCRFLAAGLRGYNLKDELYVVLEDNESVKRRRLKARLNSAKTRRKGYKLMGYSGITLVKPYRIVLRAFIPTFIYKYLHTKQLNKKAKSN